MCWGDAGRAQLSSCPACPTPQTPQRNLGSEQPPGFHGELVARDEAGSRCPGQAVQEDQSDPSAHRTFSASCAWEAGKAKEGGLRQRGQRRSGDRGCRTGAVRAAVVLPPQTLLAPWTVWVLGCVFIWGS